MAVIADRTLYLTDAGLVVEDGHPEANFLMTWKGRSYEPGELAELEKRYGIRWSETAEKFEYDAEAPADNGPAGQALAANAAPEVLEPVEEAPAEEPEPEAPEPIVPAKKAKK